MSVLEDQQYQADGGVMSPKAKLLLRDAKKELLRCVTLTTTTATTTTKRENETRASPFF